MELFNLRLKEPQKIFCDYLYHFDNVQSFFSYHYSRDWERCLAARGGGEYPRLSITEILRTQNRRWGAPEKVLRNIDLLADKKTVTVVTGQQAGLFGGPLYTFYKALGAIKLAAYLKQQFREWQFVPLFWMEVNDNDYREINHCQLFDLENRLVTLQLPPMPDDFRSIFWRKLPPEVTDLHRQLGEITFPSEFKAEILQTLQEFYAPGESLADAFARWLLFLLGEMGLVMFNPADRRVGELARPLYRAALEKREAIRERFTAINEEIVARGYPVQVRLEQEQTLLFFEAEDRARCRVDFANGEFLIRHPRQPYTRHTGALFRELEIAPHRFSPNVALRPILQDYLLPTVAYVAGPAEVSYFAQLGPLYNLLRVTPPVVYPRPRLTLMEKKIQRLVHKFGIDYIKIFAEREKLIEHYLQRHTGEEIEQRFHNLETSVTNALQALGEVLLEIDPNLQKALDKTAGSIHNSLNKLRGRVNQSLEQRLQTEVQQLQRIQTYLFPGGKYQERVLNMLYFLTKYGKGFISELYFTFSITDPHHQLILI